MKCEECLPMDEIFSHTDLSGVTRHFNTSAMARAVGTQKVKPMLCSLTLHKEVVDHIRMNHGVEEFGLKRAEQRLEVPIFLVQFKDESSIVVDGNHRVVLAASKGLDSISALVFTEDQFTSYMLEDFPIGVSDA